MTDPLAAGLVRILDAKQTPRGAGVFAADNIVLTCAHVAAAALGLGDVPAEAPQAGLWLDFPLLAPGQRLAARITAWHPDRATDLAVLEITNGLPPGACPVTWLGDDELWGHAFRAFGFPQGYEGGVPASGRILNSNADGWLALEDLKTTGYPLQRGFSGGPVWDENLGGVIGMVIAADATPGLKTGFCLPAPKLAETCEALKARLLTPLERTRQRYLECLRETYQPLDFKGIPQLDNFSRRLALEDVYVPLLARPERPAGETWERRLAGRSLADGGLADEALAREARAAAPRPVEEALGEHQRLVILGDPGSGKSTLLKHLALRLAGQENGALPVILPLNAYAAAQQHGELPLEDFLPLGLQSLGGDIPGLKELIAAAIRSGSAVILLDGLDEVQTERTRLVGQIERFAAAAVKQGCRLVLTSRIVGYREAPLSARDWALYTLLDFDPPAIAAFAEKWCLAFEIATLGDTQAARKQAEAERLGLLAALQANPGVARLASNPLLLTILALIKRQGVVLPSRRVELYEIYLKTLISAWSRARALDKRPVGPPLDYLETINVLGPLALWLREKNPTQGLVQEEPLRDWLAGHFETVWGLAPGPARERALGFLQSVRTYSNLVVERGEGRFGFIHLTFEEALAARGIVKAGQIQLEKSLGIIQSHLTDPAWRETILLAVGVWGLVREEAEKAGQVVCAMLDMDCGAEQAGQNLLLAGACLEDVGASGLTWQSARQVQQALLEASRRRSLPPEVQRDAGFVLGRLAGSSPDFLAAICPDLDAFVRIPDGDFVYQDGKARIPAAYEIARYPVTNLQYQKFIAAGGYTEKKYWSAEGWEWRARRKVTQPDYWNDAMWNNPLAPVVGVSWYEAEAYCRWLSVASGQAVRLPTEQEWERAARGVEGREYAWGDKLEAKRCNGVLFWDGEKATSYTHNKSASTTIVGQFPEGNTPDGICDLTGNVWEWTTSGDGNSPVLRGGSWHLDPINLRAANRLRNIPEYRLSNIGFRCVRSL